MILKTFKNNNPASFLLLPILAILLWLVPFINPTSTQYNSLADSLLLFELNPLLNHPLLSKFIAFILVIVGALLINYTLNTNEILKRSYLPAMIYTVLMSIYSTHLLHPILISNIFILLSIGILLNSYRKDFAFSNVFNAGVFTSISIIIYLPFITILPILWIAIAILRPFIWREWVIAFIGFLFPLVLFFSYLFLSDQLILSTNHILLFLKFKGIDLVFNQGFNQISNYIVLFITFISLIGMLKTVSVGVQKSKKGIVILILLSIFLIASFYYSQRMLVHLFAPLCIPLSTIFSYYFLSVKKEKWSEFLFIILLVSIIFDQLYNFL